MMRYYSSVVEQDIGELLDDLRDVLPAFSNTAVCVTGASGFLMSYIVELLLAWGHGCRVVAVDNFKTGAPARLAHIEGHPGLTLVRHDVSKPIDIHQTVRWIVHGASIASPTVYRQFPLETIAANVEGTRHLLDLAREHQVRGIVVMSTSEIYGDPAPQAIPTPEDYRGNVSCTGPRACYDESKRMAETLATTYHRLYGTPVKLIRPFNVYGPGLRLDDRRVLPDFMSRLLSGEAIELLSDGSPTRSFCYIKDAIALMMRVLASAPAGEAINTGNDEVEISMAGLADAASRAVAAELGTAPLPVIRRTSSDADYLVDNPQRRCPDLFRARHLFPDWSPSIGLEEGLHRYARHLIETHGAVAKGPKLMVHTGG